MTKRAMVIALFATGCGAGVPIELSLDELTLEISIDDSIAEIERALAAAGQLPPGTTRIPDRWPAQLPNVCFDDLLAAPDPALPVDLTPDPTMDSAAADQYAELNEGLVDRIEIQNVTLSIEENTLDVALPPIQLQAADRPTASSTDAAAWWTIGTLGGLPLAGECGTPATEPLAAPGEKKELDLVFARGGESFLLRQLTDPDCAANQRAAGQPEDPLRCKELALRARSRVVFDTAKNPNRPHGMVKLRLILVATFFVNPVD